MKLKKIRLVMLCIFGILFVGCRSRIENNKSDANSADIEKILHKIVFIMQDTNWSDTYQNRGYYIDDFGNKVQYDVSIEGEQYEDITDLVSYLESKEDVEREPCLNENQLNQCFDWLLNIPSDYTLDETSKGADQGSHCFYGIRYEEDGKMLPILLEESGDWVRTNTDSNAINIMDQLHNFGLK